MKAVIMAGGEGVRLRPITLARPKPMHSLFDKPVLEDLILRLKEYGITDLCITLGYMAQTVIDYFGDGSRWGVRMTYWIEREPLGTAGSVKACMERLGEDDFLVLSGDGVWDFDLSAVMGFHKTRRSVATLALCRVPAQPEYGLVLTDEEGRVQRFAEKPAGETVVGSLVNAGVYVLTAAAMAQVPDGRAFDFGRDLFPRLLEQEAPLYGVTVEGYWRDVGDCESYLQCVADALSGKVGLHWDVPKVAPGIWSAAPLPPQVALVPPCYIGAGVTIGEGSLIGPHVSLEAGSTVGAGSLVQRTVLHGGRVDERATLYGAILCPGAAVEQEAVLNEGVVLGENAIACRDAVLMERVKLPPGEQVQAGSRLTAGKGRGRRKSEI